MATTNEALIESVRKKFFVLSQILDERSKRIWVATEALAIGRGGIAVVATATGVDPKTINVGNKVLGGKPPSLPEGESRFLFLNQTSLAA